MTVLNRLCRLPRPTHLFRLLVLLAALSSDNLALWAGENFLPGQIIVDPDDPGWFRYHRQGSFFMCGPGDPEGFLYRGTRQTDGTRRGDQLELIAKLSSTEANSIYLMAVRSHGGDGDRFQNPFVAGEPDKGLSEAVLDQWEIWFQEMDRQGIVIYFFFYDDSSRIWDTGDDVGADERSFVIALVDRFEHHKHLIWVVAEEYQERYSPRRASRIAAEIRLADDHDHPIAIHKLQGIGFEEFGDDDSVDQYAIQYNQATASEIHTAVLEAQRQSRGRYNLNLAESRAWGTGVTSRRKMWSAAMAGAYVMVFEMDIASTPINDLEDCGRLVRFMESIDLTGLEPHDDLASGDAIYALAKPTENYVLYAPGGHRPIGIRNLPAGTYKLRWLSIETGRLHSQIETVSNSIDPVGWKRPARFTGELALHVRRSTDQD